MLGTTFYHHIQRNYIIAIGNLFNNIWIQRKGYSIKVPIAHGDKSRWYRIKQKEVEYKTSNKKTIKGVAPKSLFSVTIDGYDSTRKRNTLNIMDNQTVSPTTETQLECVPYTWNVELFAHFIDIEDSLQYQEQVLPYFTPAFNLPVKEINEMGIIKDCPLEFTGLETEIENEEGGEDTKETQINLTFSFKLKGNLYKPVSSDVPVITTPIVTIITDFEL